MCALQKALAGPKAKKVAVQVCYVELLCRVSLLEGPASLCSTQKDKLAIAAAAASKKRTAKAAVIRQSVASAGAPQRPAKVSSACC